MQKDNCITVLEHDDKDRYIGTAVAELIKN